MASRIWAAVVAMSVLVPWAASAADEVDPFLWLEEVQGARALAWVKEQNARTTKVLEAVPEFAPTEAKTLAILDSKEKIPTPDLLGTAVYNFWRDGEHQHGLWRRTTLASYRTSSPAWETVLDVDALAKADGVDWVFHGAQCLAPEYRRCLITLSRGGSDAAVVREFDTVAKQFVAGGFAAPGGEVAGGVARPRHALGRHRLRPRVADLVGVPAHPQAVDARHAPRRSEDRARGPAGGRLGERGDRDPLRRPLRRGQARCRRSSARRRSSCSAGAW